MMHSHDIITKSYCSHYYFCKYSHRVVVDLLPLTFLSHFIHPKKLGFAQISWAVLLETARRCPCLLSLKANCSLTALAEQQAGHLSCKNACFKDSKIFPIY